MPKEVCMPSIQHISIHAGKKVQTYLHVGARKDFMPITIISGPTPGPTLLITAGIHGCEYPGILAAIELGRDLLPTDIQGTLILLPITNPTAFTEKVPYIVPEDQKNLNRVFSGDRNGTLSEQIAAMIMQDIIPHVDYHVDLHSGDLPEDLTPYVYYPGKANQTDTVKIAQSMALALDIPYMVESKASSGSYNASALAGVPSILIERGGMGHCCPHHVKAFKEDIQRLLAHFHMIAPTNTHLQNHLPIPTHRPRLLTDVNYIAAPISGCWVTNVHAGHVGNQGDQLGIITDIFGNTLKVITAEYDYVVLYLETGLSIKERCPLIAYAHLAHQSS